MNYKLLNNTLHLGEEFDIPKLKFIYPPVLRSQFPSIHNLPNGDEKLYQVDLTIYFNRVVSLLEEYVWSDTIKYIMFGAFMDSVSFIYLEHMDMMGVADHGYEFDMFLETVANETKERLIQLELDIHTYDEIFQLLKRMEIPLCEVVNDYYNDLLSAGSLREDHESDIFIFDWLESVSEDNVTILAYLIKMDRVV